MRRRSAIRRSALAYAGFGVLIAVLVLVVLLLVDLGTVWSVLIAVASGVALSWFAHTRADVIALRSLGARPLDAGEVPQLENLVHGLVVANGFRMPTLYVVDDTAPNAAAVGRTPKRSGVIVTSGILERLRRIELEGVLAHALTRVRSGEALVGTTAGLLVGRLPKTLSQSLASRMLDNDSTYHADRAGVALTRYPPGLAGALASMRSDGRVVKHNPRAYRHLWINIPEEALIEPAFSLDARIDSLAEL